MIHSALCVVLACLFPLKTFAVQNEDLSEAIGKPQKKAPFWDCAIQCQDNKAVKTPFLTPPPDNNLQAEKTHQKFSLPKKNPLILCQGGIEETIVQSRPQPLTLTLGQNCTVGDIAEIIVQSPSQPLTLILDQNCTVEDIAEPIIQAPHEIFTLTLGNIVIQAPRQTLALILNKIFVQAPPQPLALTLGQNCTVEDIAEIIIQASSQPYMITLFGEERVPIQKGWFPIDSQKKADFFFNHPSLAGVRKNVVVRDTIKVTPCDNDLLMTTTGDKITEVLRNVSDCDGKTLDIFCKNLSKISGFFPPSFLDITCLCLELNGLQDIEFISSLIHLQTFRATGNKIKNLFPLAKLTKLENLVLNENNIEDVSPLSGLTNLETLDLCDNSINDVSPLSHLEKIILFFITNNPVKNTDIIDLRCKLINCKAFFD